MKKYQFSALYKFSNLANLADKKKQLLGLMQGRQVVGTIILAEEGVNGTISGLPSDVGAVVEQVRSWSGFDGLEEKKSYADQIGFGTAMVKVKQEIVTIRDEGADEKVDQGIYIEPKNWNGFISQPDVVLLDVRNCYECSKGTFKGAIDPEITNFVDLKQFIQEQLEESKDKKIAMFCTGGIRCEKAAAFMLSKGFKNIYQLKGGILKYLEVVDEKDSLWTGRCFVFDDRVSLDHRLQPETDVLGFCKP